jgi:hypothetical protein
MTMSRDRVLQEVVDCLVGRGFGCHLRSVGEENHLMCSHVGKDGRHMGPCFWLCLSSRGEWFVLTMQDECYVLGSGAYIAEVAENILVAMDDSMSIPIEIVSRYKLVRCKIVDDTDKLDLEYSK